MKSSTTNINEKEKKYSLLDIASWFLKKGCMSTLKLQILCYYSEAWCYALYGYSLTGTSFTPRDNGPFSRDLYENFKEYGYNEIQLGKNISIKIESQDEKLLLDVFETYGTMSENALIALSSSEPPYKVAKALSELNKNNEVEISREVMKSYYLSIYEEDNE